MVRMLLAGCMIYVCQYWMYVHDQDGRSCLGVDCVTPTFYKNKDFVQIGMHIKMHIKL
jgi:hypothetical protein